MSFLSYLLFIYYRFVRAENISFLCIPTQMIWLLGVPYFSLGNKINNQNPSLHNILPSLNRFILNHF